MADISQIFSHSTPTVLPGEAPVPATTPGDRILNQVFDIADDVIKGYYGTKAAIPNGRSDTRQVNATGFGAMLESPTGIAGLSVGVLLIVAVILYFIWRR